ncbi:hypothetical protein SESBI_24475 [Sesbania bispinosa]|nr:hypothetical protein SESBI_24475 [Sesbania bispinosa]
MMQTQQIHSPTTGAPKLRPRSGRTPLQPKNSPADPIHPSTKPKPKPDHSRFEISAIHDSDKENRPIVAVANPPAPSLETSLAEELSAIKKKLERLRADKEKTEKKLKEKDAILDAKMKEMEERGEIQKNFEIEVDRLFRLKELKYRCMRVSPMRTLREKEQGKIVNETPSRSETLLLVAATNASVVLFSKVKDRFCRFVLSAVSISHDATSMTFIHVSTIDFRSFGGIASGRVRSGGDSYRGVNEVVVENLKQKGGVHNMKKEMDEEEEYCW